MSIARNTLHYSSALVFQKVLGFIYFALIARGLGVEATGQYVFALSFTTLFAVLADIGFAPVLTREIAKNPENTQSLFTQVFSVKVLISVITYGLVVLFVNILNYPDITKTLVYIAGIVMVLDSFSLIFWSVFRGFQNLRFEAKGVIGHQSITVVLGLTALYLGLGVVPLLIATAVGSLFYALFSLWLLLHHLKIKLAVKYDRESIKWFLKTALPFALAGVFARIYTQIDTVMLSKLGCSTQAICDQYVGWYGIASKVTLALQFIPMALAASLYPALSEQFEHAPERLTFTFERAWKYLAIIVLPLSGGVIVFARELVTIVWGTEFINAALPLQILMGSLVFLFLTFPNGSLLNAAGRQLTNTVFMGIAVVINVGMNIWLISTMQMTGAAIASISSTFVLFFLGFIMSYVLIQFRAGSLLFSFSKLFITAAVVSWTMFNLKSGIHYLLLIPLGGLLYLIIIYLFGEIEKSDVQVVRQLLKRRSKV